MGMVLRHACKSITDIEKRLMSIRFETVLFTGVAIFMTLVAVWADDATLASSRAASVHKIGTTTITLSEPKDGVPARWEEGRSGCQTEPISIGFDKDVRMNGNWIPAGTYRITLQRVAENDFHVVLNQADFTGKKLDAELSREVLRLAVRPSDAPPTDRFRIGGIELLLEEEEEDTDDDEEEEEEEDDEGDEQDEEDEDEGEDEEEEEEREEDHEEDDRSAELYFHWGTRKVTVRLEMTGMRRRATPAPEMPKPVRTPWSVVLASLEALVAEDLEKHIEAFADNFESDFDDGGSALAHAQLLGHIRRGGGLEGLLLSLDQVNWTADERSAEFRNIVIYTAEDRFVFTYRLVKTDEGWKTVYLGAE